LHGENNCTDDRGSTEQRRSGGEADARYDQTRGNQQDASGTPALKLGGQLGIELGGEFRFRPSVNCRH
jgi:hypothetical protein